MERITLSSGKNALEMSRIVYGMWRIADDADTSVKHVQAKIEACLEQGITTMDQADIYGGYVAEAVFGECLKASPSLRDQIEIVTKCDIVAPAGRYSDARVKYYDTSAEHISKSIEYSLSEMNIETIDLLLIHRPDPFMDHHETGKALDSAVTSGKVRTVGVSNFKQHDWNLLQSDMDNKLITNQIEMSVLATDAFTNGDLAFHQQHDIKPMAWSPLGGGALFDENNAETESLRFGMSAIAERHSTSIDALAVAWLLAHPANILPVMGTNNIDRIKSLSAAESIKLDRQTWYEIYSLAIGNEVP